MKGIIYTTLNEMVEEKLGIETWESLLDSVCPASGGIYTATAEYKDSELKDILVYLSEKTGSSIPDLMHSYGVYLFSVLATKYPVFLEKETTLFGFLKSIEDVIHKEVRKLYSNPNLPTMDWKDIGPRHMEMYYRSPRKFCFLACGLIEAAAEKYQEDITLDHTTCMHENAEFCTFSIRTNDI